MYAIGDCADDILANLRINKHKGTCRYEKVCTAVNSYFNVSCNRTITPAKWQVKLGYFHSRFVQACTRL